MDEMMMATTAATRAQGQGMKRGIGARREITTPMGLIIMLPPPETETENDCEKSLRRVDGRLTIALDRLRYTTALRRRNAEGSTPLVRMTRSVHPVRDVTRNVP